MTQRVLALLMLAMAPLVQAQDELYVFAQGDRVEYQSYAERAVWDLQGWYGGDLHKFWWKLEGTSEPDQENELQLLYSRAVSPYFDAQFGVRLDEESSGSDSSLVVGLQGLAAYNIEIDAAAFFTEDGAFEFQAEIERDFRLTQRFVLQPRIELSMSSEVDDNAALEMRLRYEINRKAAPYVGVSWQRNSAEGAPDRTSTNIVAGLRFMF